MPKPRGSAPVLFLLISLAAGCGSEEPSACSGFGDRKLAITGSEYRSCANEILSALDEVEPPLRKLVSGSGADSERDAAQSAYRRLSSLIRQTGIEADYRSMRPGTAITKWPDSSVSSFNLAAFTAKVQYMAVISHPNADNFAQGVKAHDDARRYHRAIR
jgi:hypothetical protein